MLLLLNKTIKPLNQSAEKIQKKSVFEATADNFLTIFDKIFSHFFSCYTQVLVNPVFIQITRKRNDRQK